MTTYWAELGTNNIVTKVITGVDDATIEGIPTGDWYTNFTGSPCVQTWIDRDTKPTQVSDISTVTTHKTLRHNQQTSH